MSDNSGRNLLMIAYKFPPMHNTACVRTWGFHQSIKPYFDSVTVISTSNRHLLRQEAVDMGDAEVYDADTFDYRTVLQKKKSKQSVVGDKSKESIIGKVGQKLNASYPSIYIFGEGGLKYIRSALKIGKQVVEERSITHVFSTFSPYADHIVAHDLKAKFPSLFWIADFRDLHVDPTQHNLFFRQAQKNWNKKMLKAADIITTVSEGLAKHLNEFNTNVYVLRNGIEEISNDDAPIYDDKFTISYTGSMYGDRRNPDLLLQSLVELIDAQIIPRDKLRLTYAGKDSDVWLRKAKDFGIIDILEDRGLVSRKEAMAIQRRSSINLLLTHSGPGLTGIITGKIFEYFNARRPVLVIVIGPADDEIESLITNDFGQVVYRGDSGRVISFISELYHVWQQADTGSPSRNYSNFLKLLSWDNIIKDFAGHIGIANGHIL